MDVWAGTDANKEVRRKALHENSRRACHSKAARVPDRLAGGLTGGGAAEVNGWWVVALCRCCENHRSAI